MFIYRNGTKGDQYLKESCFMEYSKRDAVRYIGKLSNKIRQRMEAIFSSEEFSGTQGRVLSFLLTQERDLFQKDIEEEYNIRSASATSLLHSMERNGLITRTVTKEDGRMKKIQVTPKGASYKEMIAENRDQLMSSLQEGISQEEMEVFYSVVERMLANM